MTNEISMQTRAASLALITGGKADWYATRKQCTAAEGAHGVEWIKAEQRHQAAAEAGPVKSSRGTWGRPIRGTSTAAEMTRAECEAAGLTPGPGNN